MKIWHKQFLEKTQSSLLRLALSATIDIDIDIDIACRFLLSIPLAEMLSMQEPGDKQSHLLMPRNLTKFLAHHRHTPRPRDHRNQPINIGAELGRRELQSISAAPMALRKILDPRRRFAAGGRPRAEHPAQGKQDHADKPGPQTEPPYSRLINSAVFVTNRQ